MAYKNKKQKQTDDKKITVAEFRSWIAGFEELNEGTNWSPTSDQWKKIRAKIESIDDTVVITKTVQSGSPVKQTEVVAITPPVAMMTPPPPSAPAGPQPPSALGAPRMTGTVPTGAPLLMEEPAGRGTLIQGAPKVKTPDIDTSSGQYQSPFGA